MSDEAAAPNPSTAAARVLVDELARAGVVHVVLAPGSRSAALAIAVAEDPRLRAHVEVDERSAGFCALGVARGGGAPAAVVTTSGTAVANLMPAVVEADEARVPLLVVSANRPPELRDAGANQTIDQTRLFGERVRFFAELAVGADVPGEQRAWRSITARAIAEARGLSGPAGPSHLDVAFREPTVPTPDDGRTAARPYTQPLDGRGDGRPWTAVTRALRRAEDATVDALAARVAAEPRGLVVLGDTDADVEAVHAFARAAGWLVAAEPLAAVRSTAPTTQGTGGSERAAPASATVDAPPGSAVSPVLAAAPYLAAHPEFAESHAPGLVLRAGRGGLSRALGRLVARAPQVLVDPDGVWLDPERVTGDIIAADPGDLLARVAARLRERRETAGRATSAESGDPVPSAWLAAWRAADAAAATAVAEVLDAEEAPSEPRAARDAAAATPPHGLLLAGSSMPVRDLDLVLPPGEGPRVIGNRGASGIDGLVSTALGAALWAGTPVVALLGDLALLHDAGGLLLSPELRDGERLDCVIVALNNDGGGIFSFLPPASHTDATTFERVFATPHGRDLGALARFHGLGYTRVAAAHEVAPAVEAALATGGIHLVEVPTDRAANRALHARMEEAALAAVTRALAT